MRVFNSHTFFIRLYMQMQAVQHGAGTQRFGSVRSCSTALPLLTRMVAQSPALPPPHSPGAQNSEFTDLQQNRSFFFIVKEAFQPVELVLVLWSTLGFFSAC